ncbi:MAG: catalase [Gammaproteobacteria bacterium]|nr:MAG: catalase [Gammaproteobacteria bacterium]
MISSIPSVSANTAAPYTPPGRQPVGLESTELKSSSFKALEESAGSGAAQNRRTPEDRPNEQGEKIRLNADQAAVRDRSSKGKSDPNEKERLAKEQKQIDELAAIDRSIRAHEHAHSSVAGRYAGSTTYSFVRGPDGISYAVGGEVSIDTSPIPNDPEASIRKAQQIRMAANAPADPSSQDRRVASQAASLENEARAQLATQKTSEIQQAQQQSDGKVGAQKAEVEQQASNEESLRSEIKREAEKQQVELDRSNQERSEILAKSARTTFDISRRLVEIGAVKSTPSLGNLFDISI